jgi:nicotinate phosphoribosyltransferase
MKYDLKPMGTHAHEWFMAMMGLFGIRIANQRGLQIWSEAFDGVLGTALTDTFTTEAFLNDFTAYYAKLFDSVRPDSGDPFVIGDRLIAHYEGLRIDPITKTIIFSDNLTVEKAVELFKYFAQRIMVAFGIGTHFTNDCGLTPLKIVIMMTRIRNMLTRDKLWVDVCKVSDDRGKNNGKKSLLRMIERELGIRRAA